MKCGDNEHQTDIFMNQNNRSTKNLFLSSLTNDMLKQISKECYNDLMGKYMSDKKDIAKKQFREDLMSRQFNTQLSYLALNNKGKARVKPFITKKFNV